MAMNFIGTSSQRLTLSSSLSTFQNVTGGTCMCWVSLQGTLPTTETLIMYFSTGTVTTSVRFGISFRGQITRFRAAARRLDANSVSTVDGTTAPVSGTTYHVCAVAEFNNAIMRIYVNGVQENTVAIAGWTAATSNTASLSAYIASNNTGSYLTGIITDARTYNRALTAQEVFNVYGAKGRDSIVSGMQDRWKMVDGPPGANGTPQSIGLLQGWASQTNNPLYADNLGISSRRSGT
jgi:hypothetical protein